MSRLGRLLRRPKADLFLLLRMALLLQGVRVGLRLLSFQRLRRLLRRSAQRAQRNYPETEIVRVVWAAEAASPFLLGDNGCLTKALAMQYLLHRRGFATTLRIGVAKLADGTLQGHAWLEYHGMILVGGEQSPQHFVSFPPLDEEEKPDRPG